MDYPKTRRGEVVETLHGHEIADPYRWLEDPDSEETRAWVAAQNALTEAFLADVGSRSSFSELMRTIVLRPVVTPPMYRSGWYLLSRNDGSAPQNTWYVARSLDELAEGGRVLFDPSTWSEDGTSSLAGLSVAGDGSLAAYAVSAGGSDWQHVRIIDPSTSEPLDEPEVVSKFSSLRWLPDHRTFLYTHYRDARAEGTSTEALPHPVIKAHTVGTGVETDPVVLEFPDDPRRSLWPDTSSDGRWIAMAMNHGTDEKFAMWLSRTDGAKVGEPLRVIEEFSHYQEFVDVVDDVLYLVTDEDAPRGRLVALDLAAVEAGEPAAWRTVVPETEHALSGAVLAGDVLVVHHLADASPVLTRYSLDGEDLGRLDVTGGSVLAMSGEAGRDELLVAMDSVTSPMQAFVVTPSTGDVRALSLVEETWRAPDLEITRHRATSADGTPVPYWLLRPAGLPDEPVPTLMYGYGGFNVAIGASFSSIDTGWLTAGGAVAIANLRGGGEFGTEWYEQGTRAAKQNVFDDFAALGEHLIATGVTTSPQLAAYGASNGGLLIGALITQHPGLVAAAVPMVGVLDLLRFHRFTIGSAWISDYGDPDVAEDFEVALAYSPLHHIREGETYPATLVVTGDHDDRVVPAHSHKFTATLQRAQGGEAPILTRVETSTGHGAGKPRAVAAQEAADVLAFLAHHTGLVLRAH